MAFYLDYKYQYLVIIDIIDYTVMSRYTARIGHAPATYQRLRMSYALTRVLHDIIEAFLKFL